MTVSHTSPELSVVIPIWGDEQNLKALIPSLEATLGSLVHHYEIIVSTGPGNHQLHKEAPGSATTFVRAERSGYGHVLRRGLAVARGRFVITMDGDFSHRPGFVRTMWHHRDQGEVLIASRYMKGAYAEMSLARQGFSRILNLVYRIGLSLPYRDLSSGLRLFKREALVDIGMPRGESLDALPEMVTRAVCQGWKVREVPFWYQGAKPWTRARMVKLGVGYLRTLGALLALRNSVKAADYDHRAFDSLIPLQRYWQRKRFRIIQAFAAEANWLLDIGCGTSRIVQHLPGAVGMDVALRKLRWLRAPGRVLVQGSLSELPFKEDSFDAVICSEVIEHIPREEVHLDEMVKLVRPGGLLILSTPDYGRWIWRFIEWVYGKVFPGGYVDEHINRYTNAGLRTELQGLGLEVLDCRYVGFSEMIFKARLPAVSPVASSPEARLGELIHEDAKYGA